MSIHIEGYNRDYEGLIRVLIDAYKEAAHGKGLERHAESKPFERQDICQEARDIGIAFNIGQARKKAKESLRIMGIKGREAAVNELLGAINYLAGAVIVIREMTQIPTVRDSEPVWDVKPPIDPMLPCGCCEKSKEDTEREIALYGLR